MLIQAVVLVGAIVIITVPVDLILGKAAKLNRGMEDHNAA